MKICIFASGQGSNFQAIVDAINKKYLKSEISLLITNNSGCGAVDIAVKNKIPFVHISRTNFPDLTDETYSDKFSENLREFKIDFIVLAGYMKMIEKSVLKDFHNRIVNIHPALLPSFGGKGMYGINVHKAVIESGVKVSGVTVHFVDEHYDKGKIIFQKCCDVLNEDDEFSLQEKIKKMEHRYYPEVIRMVEDGLKVSDTNQIQE